MVPRLLAAARAMRSRTCADVIQPCSCHVITQAVRPGFKFRLSFFRGMPVGGHGKVSVTPRSNV